MKRKIISITISFIIGLIWGLYFEKNMASFFLFYSIIVGLFCVYIVNKEKIFILINSIILIISFLYSYNLKISIKVKYENIDKCEVVVIGNIDKIEIDNQDYKKIVIKIKYLNNDSQKYSGDKLIVNIKKCSQSFCEGDNIVVKGSFQLPDPAKNYKSFDYRAYLKSINIYGYIDANNVVKVGKNNEIINMYISRLRLSIKRKFNKYLPEDVANMCIALTLGDKNQLDKNIQNEFSDTGLSYILAISGMHLNYIILFFSICTRIFSKRKQQIIICILIVVFSIVSGSSYSIVRACIMTVLFYISKLIHRKSDSLTNLCIASILILISNPYAIKNTGFIFSFLGTLGIIIVLPILQKVKFKNISNVLRKAAKYYKKQIDISVSSNLVTFPVTIYLFNKFYIGFLFISPIINIFMSILMPIILSFIGISHISELGSKVLSKIINFIMEQLLKIVNFFSNMGIFKVVFVTPNYIQILIMYVICILIVMKTNAKINNVSKDIKIIKKISKSVISISLIVSIIVFFLNFTDKQLNIYFVDVGQGDSTFIITPLKQKILIDGGGSQNKSDSVGKLLYKYILNRKTTKLDYILISHFDSDHVRWGFILIRKY